MAEGEDPVRPDLTREGLRETVRQLIREEPNLLRPNSDHTAAGVPVPGKWNNSTMLGYPYSY